MELDVKLDERSGKDGQLSDLSRDRGWTWPSQMSRGTLPGECVGRGAVTFITSGLRDRGGTGKDTGGRRAGSDISHCHAIYSVGWHLRIFIYFRIMM